MRKGYKKIRGTTIVSMALVIFLVVLLIWGNQRKSFYFESEQFNKSVQAKKTATIGDTVSEKRISEQYRVVSYSGIQISKEAKWVTYNGNAKDSEGNPYIKIVLTAYSKYYYDQIESVVDTIPPEYIVLEETITSNISLITSQISEDKRTITWTYPKQDIGKNEQEMSFIMKLDLKKLSRDFLVGRERIRTNGITMDAEEDVEDGAWVVFRNRKRTIKSPLLPVPLSKENREIVNKSNTVTFFGGKRLSNTAKWTQYMGKETDSEGNPYVEVELQVRDDAIKTNSDTDIIIVMQNSRSPSLDVKEEYLLKKEKTDAINCVNKLLTGKTGRKVAVISYREEAEIVHDFSSDMNSINKAINAVSVEGKKANMQAGLYEAQEMFRRSNAKNKYIIFMTDGYAEKELNDYALTGPQIQHPIEKVHYKPDGYDKYVSTAYMQADITRKKFPNIMIYTLGYDKMCDEKLYMVRNTDRAFFAIASMDSKGKIMAFDGESGSDALVQNIEQKIVEGYNRITTDPKPEDSVDIVISLEPEAKRDTSYFKDTFELEKKDAVKFVNAILDTKRNARIAITAGTRSAYVVHDFSSDKNSLINAINNLTYEHYDKNRNYTVVSTPSVLNGLYLAQNVLDRSNADKKYLIYMSRACAGNYNTMDPSYYSDVPNDSRVDLTYTDLGEQGSYLAACQAEILKSKNPNLSFYAIGYDIDINPEEDGCTACYYDRCTLNSNQPGKLLIPMANFDCNGVRLYFSKRENFDKAIDSIKRSLLGETSKIAKDLYVEDEISTNKIKRLEVKIPPEYTVLENEIKTNKDYITADISNDKRLVTYYYEYGYNDNDSQKMSLIMTLDKNSIDKALSRRRAMVWTNGETYDVEKSSFASALLTFGNRLTHVSSPKLSLPLEYDDEPTPGEDIEDGDIPKIELNSKNTFYLYYVQNKLIKSDIIKFSAKVDNPNIGFINLSFIAHDDRGKEVILDDSLISLYDLNNVHPAYNDDIEEYRLELDKEYFLEFKKSEVIEEFLENKADIYLNLYANNNVKVAKIKLIKRECFALQ